MSDASLFNVEELAAAPPPTSSGLATTHSLYRKYRPTSFDDDDLVGQDHVVNTLRNAIALDRIAHAYLFCGPRGTGKTTTARLLAKAVNCLDPDPKARPCNVCSACVAINTNATSDVIEIDAASNRGIDDIRDLRERVKYAPTQLKSKFYIIDEAHQITGAAANAFLKTLEEPPAHTRFVLATTDPEELLQTIVSRCQRFDFRRINLEAMISRLKTVATAENIAIEEAALPIIARQATGSLRDALGMLDQVAIYRESDSDVDEIVTAATVREVLGISRNERVESLARALADHDPAAGLREISAALDAGDDIRQLGRQLVSYIRMLMLQKASGTEEADETAIEIAGRFGLDDLARLLRLFSEIDFKARRSSMPQLPLELAIVQGASQGPSATKPVETTAQANAAWEAAPPTNPGYRQDEDYGRPPVASEAPTPAAPRASLRERVRGTASMPPPPKRSEQSNPEAREMDRSAPRDRQDEQPAMRSSAPLPAASGQGASSGGELSVAHLADLWPKIRADVKAVNRRIEALLQQVDPAAVNGTQVTLVSPYEFHRNRVNSDDIRRVVEDVISRLVGQSVQVQCLSREEANLLGNRSAAPSPAATAPQVARAPQRESEPAAPAARPAHTTATEHEAPPPEEPMDDPAMPPSATMDPKGIQDRLTAARNIFDAEDIDD